MHRKAFGLGAKNWLTRAESTQGTFRDASKSVDKNGRAKNDGQNLASLKRVFVESVFAIIYKGAVSSTTGATRRAVFIE
jgi:hypothetical protein